MFHYGVHSATLELLQASDTQIWLINRITWGTGLGEGEGEERILGNYLRSQASGKLAKFREPAVNL